MRYITSQHYLDQGIVDAKLATQDFTVSYIEVDIEGETMGVVVDGHHSLEAAKQAGIDPEFEHSETMQREYKGMTAEAVLEACWMDGDYIDTLTGELIW